MTKRTQRQRAKTNSAERVEGTKRTDAGKLNGLVPTRRMKIADLVPAPYNPREIKEPARQALMQSLRRYGLVQPAVYNEQTKHVVGGHRRLELLRACGIEETDVVPVNVSLDEEKALNLVLNNPAAMGEFTNETIQLLEEIRGELPDAFDELLLWQIKNVLSEAEQETGTDENEQPEGQYDLSPEVYESYNYVVLIFRNDIDWTAAMEHFGLKSVQAKYLGKGKPKIGMGRVVEGSDYLRHQVIKTPSQESNDA